MSDPRLARLRLVFVTPGDREGPATVELVERVAEGGVTAVLMRELQLSPAERRPLYATLCAACRRHGVMSLVSRDHELALASGADGVHTGWGGPSVGTVRAAAKGLLVGRSAHWPLDVDDTAADYVTLSPFRPTHRSARRPVLGEAQVAGALATPGLGPVVALGGVTAADVPDLPPGIAGVAVMRALADAPDPRGAAAVLRSVVDARWSFGGADAAAGP